MEALSDSLRHISALLRAGEYRTAHDELLQILDAHPRHAEAVRLLAGTKQALGDPTTAEALLRQARALAPEWAPTLTTLAELLLAKGGTEEAESLLQRAITTSPRYRPAALALARHFNASARAAEALRVVAPWCASAPVDAELSAQHVVALIALGRAQDAIQCYQSILAATPGDPAAVRALSVALGATGQHHEVVRIIQPVIAASRASASLYCTHARSLIAQGQLAPAEIALREALRLDPRLVDAHNHLAQLIWVRTGNSELASAQLAEAVQMFAADDALRATLAALLQGIGDARAAYACLADRLTAHTSPALLLRAGLAALEFEPGTARELAERARRIVPENRSVQMLLTAAKLGTGDAQGAMGLCEALRAQFPDDQYLIALQTTAWRQLGDSRYAKLCDYRNLVVPFELQPGAECPDPAAFLDAVRASIEPLHDPKGHALPFQSLRHGTETTQDLTRSTDAAIRALFEAFALPVGSYLRHLGEGKDPLRRRNTGRWRFQGAWSVRLRSSGFHRNHTHPRGWISSAYYLVVPDVMRDTSTQQGVLTFGEPGILTQPPLPAEYTVRPEAGQLFLFPSYLWHGTTPFRDSQARLTVAFDAVPNP